MQLARKVQAFAEGRRWLLVRLPLLGFGAPSLSACRLSCWWPSKWNSLLLQTSSQALTEGDQLVLLLRELQPQKLLAVIDVGATARGGRHATTRCASLAVVLVLHQNNRVPSLGTCPQRRRDGGGLPFLWFSHEGVGIYSHELFQLLLFLIHLLRRFLSLFLLIL